MCGLTGFWHFNPVAEISLTEIALKMAAAIEQRGPDSAGVWQDKNTPLALAHRRLSIRDLSPNGAQPMSTPCGRWTIVYNGEIYNAEELKLALPTDIQWRGHSDTEILLHALACWGVPRALEKLNGMFAFALWDSTEQRLYLVCDRLGIKPLYYGFNNSVFFFGSQLKSFIPHPVFRPEIDFDALGSYFQLNYIPAPKSIYQNILKITPGHYVTLDKNAAITEKPYWSLLNSVKTPPQNSLTEAATVDALQQLLRDAVGKRLVADVPLGAFLSGGIDSSLVTALMQEQNASPVQTFSIGFHEAEYNEAHYAKKVAQHLGTEHHELYCSEQDAINLIPELPRWYDEPFADSSQLPTLLVSKLARSRVIVSLSGDGGDELFAGYPRYFLAHDLYRRLAFLPVAVRRQIAKRIVAIRPATWEHLAKIIPQKIRPKQLGDKAHKFARLLAEDSTEFYSNLVSHWQEPQALLQQPIQQTHLPRPPANNFIQQMQLIDVLTYLPGDILTKVDRASMAVGLEARVPLLDYRVAEFAMQLPQKFLIRDKKGKWILREILKRYVPTQLIERPKMGFGVPIDRWLRSSLRDWAEDLLLPKNLEHNGLNPQPIRIRWQEHLAGTRNWQYALWGVLMYQSWRQMYAKTPKIYDALSSYVINSR